MVASTKALYSALFSVVLTCLLPVGVTRADFRVLDSNVPQFRPGTVLPDDAKLTIPTGGWVSVLTRDRKTKTFEGPFEGPATDYKSNPGRGEVGSRISAPVPGTRDPDDE